MQLFITNIAYKVILIAICNLTQGGGRKKSPLLLKGKSEAATEVTGVGVMTPIPDPLSWFHDLFIPRHVQ